MDKVNAGITKMVWQDVKTAAAGWDHCAMVTVVDERQLQQVVAQCIDKAALYFDENVDDESCFLMFGWSPEAATLSVGVASDSKVCRNKHTVVCHFAFDTSLVEGIVENLRFYIRDCLTTHGVFYHYSLIAMFYVDTPDQCDLI